MSARRFSAPSSVPSQCQPDDLDDRFPVLLANDEDIALWLGETAAPLEEIKTLVRVSAGALIVE